MSGFPTVEWTWAQCDIPRPGVYWFTMATVADTAQKWRYRALIFQDEYADGIPDELHDLLGMAKNDEDTDVDSLPDLVELLTVLRRLEPYREAGTFSDSVWRNAINPFGAGDAARTVQLDELPEGQGTDRELDEPAREVGTQFAREHRRVGSGEVQVAAPVDPQRIDTLSLHAHPSRSTTPIPTPSRRFR